MPDKHMRDYSIRRLEKSSDDLDTAKINYDAGKYEWYRVGIYTERVI